MYIHISSEKERLFLVFLMKREKKRKYICNSNNDSNLFVQITLWISNQQEKRI